MRANKKTDTIGKEWLKRKTRPYGKSILFLTFLTAISTLFSLAFAYLVRYPINFARDKNYKALILFSVLLFVVVLVRVLLKTWNGYHAEKVRSKMFTKMRTDLYGKILISDYAQTQNFHSGDLLTRLTTDVQEVSADTVGFTPALVGMLVQCLGAIIALFTINPLFTLIYIVCGGIFGGIASLFRRQLKKTQKEVLTQDGKVRSYMQEGLGDTLTVKAYATEDKSLQKAEGLSIEYHKKRMKRNFVRSIMSFVFALLSNSGLILAVILCSISVYKGNQDYGSILSIILLLTQLQQPLTSFSSLVPVYYARIASGERLAEIDSLSVDIAQSADGETIDYDDLQSFCFESVSFTYGRERVLSGLDAEIRKGEIVCVTGSSGSGKSTIFKLLLSVYRPTEGKLSVQTKRGEKRAFNAKQRELFAYVPQGNFLFSGTIYENLTFFSNETDKEVLNRKIATALKVACAEFVLDLPQGLETLLTENGGGLSEGQLQRLAVARALVSDRPILLLDESTSALDGETERKLLENIKNLQGKTCLIVTHRPTALEIADRILRLENGKLNDCE